MPNGNKKFGSGGGMNIICMYNDPHPLSCIRRLMIETQPET